LDGILTIIAFSIGGLWLPLVCAALALKKGRSAGRWFAFDCVGMYFVPLLGAVVVLIVLACMPSGSAPKDSQKFAGFAVTPKSLLMAAGGFGVLFAIGCAGLYSAVMTILGALKY
jgi:hypothetical protein